MYWASGSFPTSQEGAVQTNNQLEGQEITHTRKRNFADEIVSGEEGNCSRAKPMKSEIWEHFKREKRKDGDKIITKAKCNYCKFVTDGSSRKGTKHLWNHFERCPGRQHGNGNLTAPVVTNRKNSVRDGGLSRLDLVREIIKHGISLINADILNVYHQEKETFRQYLGNLSCLYFLTIDIYFSCLNVDNEYLCLSVLFIDDDWEPKNKILFLKHIKSHFEILETLQKELLTWKMNKIAVLIGRYIRPRVKEEIESWIKGHYTLPFCNKPLHAVSFDDLMIKCPHCYDSRLHDMKKLSFSVQNFRDICKRSRCVTANMCFPIACDVYVKLCHLETLGFFTHERTNRETIKEFEDEWWCKYKLVLATAAVLDPRFKKDIVKKWYEKIYGKDYEAEYKTFDKYFTNVYHGYLKETDRSRSPPLVCSEGNPSSSCKMLDPFGLSYTSSNDDGDISQSNLELTLYLEEVEVARVEEFDILAWWRDNSARFPSLSKMARDVLVIPFSHRWDQVIQDVLGMGQFDVEMEEALVCTKTWLSDTNI